MDGLVPSAFAENCLYCRHYAATSRPSAFDLAWTYDSARIIASRNSRVVYSSPDELRQSGAPESFIRYLESRVWGTHVTAKSVEESLQKLREERQAQLNAPIIDEDSPSDAPLEGIVTLEVVAN